MKPVTPPQVLARNFRLAMTLAFVILLVWVTCVFWFGPEFRVGKGEAAPDAFDSAMLTFLVGIVTPTLPMLLVYMSVKGWKSLLDDKVYRWQAWLSTIAFILICLVIALAVSHAVIWADYEVDRKTALGETLPTLDCDRQIVARVQRLCTYGALFLSGSLLFGILGLERKGTR